MKQYELGGDVVALKYLEKTDGKYEEFPVSLNYRIKEVLESRGIDRLYSHQSESIESILEGKNVVVVTPTASGKTLCYNLPILNQILKKPETRAMYLFPTKALSQDQMDELHSLITDLGEDIKTYTYDGDTPDDARRAIRGVGHIIITNPDMLHTGILPHHTKWVKLFENLKYIVIDEMHYYRGVFGSHLANLFRRLKRIAAFYNSNPQFILCSATIANPKELAETMIEEEVTIVDNNGAPRGEKYFFFYNPPIVNRELGIRANYINTARRLTTDLIDNDISTITFATSRLNVEILTRYLKERFDKGITDKGYIRGYRGGYLPLVRREIERGLRDGGIKGVVSTNALELGIDIGSLEA
ncbi:MAG: DEAD/DEAH box helicase, partial [Acidobacteria bacterium]|nr:DEAD/DEAH box helicase [Acidobacteriota bacterium]